MPDTDAETPAETPAPKYNWPDRRLDPDGYLRVRNIDLDALLGKLGRYIETLRDLITADDYTADLDAKVALHLASLARSVVGLGETLAIEAGSNEVLQRYQHLVDTIVATGRDDLDVELGDAA